MEDKIIVASNDGYYSGIFMGAQLVSKEMKLQIKKQKKQLRTMTLT